MKTLIRLALSMLVAISLGGPFLAVSEPVGIMAIAGITGLLMDVTKPAAKETA